jgi:hypothetical protein
MSVLAVPRHPDPPGGGRGPGLMAGQVLGGGEGGKDSEAVGCVMSGSGEAAMTSYVRPWPEAELTRRTRLPGGAACHGSGRRLVRDRGALRMRDPGEEN